MSKVFLDTVGLLAVWMLAGIIHEIDSCRCKW